jgi:CTP synthase (UTP-ammonia lyase)
LLVLAACPVENRPPGAPRLYGQLPIDIAADSRAFRIYRSSRIQEAFNCNYEMNPVYRDTLEQAGLKVSGTGADGGARIVELPAQRFFVATGFVPQMSSAENRPHPLIVAFLASALKLA